MRVRVIRVNKAKMRLIRGFDGGSKQIAYWSGVCVLGVGSNDDLIDEDRRTVDRKGPGRSM